MKKALVTGSLGLIGSEVCAKFSSEGFEVHGLDNDQRKVFLGQGEEATSNLSRVNALPNFVPHEIDIRDRLEILASMRTLRPDIIVHAAAQPSHDRAAEIPFEDFDTNAVGTLNLLEAARQWCPETPFVFFSTNKVYGDGPNRIKLKELPTRYEYASVPGVDEDYPIDHTTHSLFGVSKASADLLTQEYGRYFGMPTCCLRAGCMTGVSQAGVEKHGFLNYLMRCVLGRKPYTVYGYKGKQVRDMLDAVDVASFVWEFYQDPGVGDVFNLGGGYDNTVSVREAIQLCREATGITLEWKYDDQARKGDHICYYSDLTEIRSNYPKWRITRSVRDIVYTLAEGLKP